MMMETSYNTTKYGHCLTDFEDYGDHFMEPNHNIEQVTSMTDMEYLYFSSDDLEYFPDDWTPASSFINDDTSKKRLIPTHELSLLTDALSDEIPTFEARQTLQLKRKFFNCPSDDSPSIKWKNNMPIACPVSRDEYYGYISQHGMCTTKCIDSQTMEMLIDDVLADAAFVHKHESLSLQHLGYESKCSQVELFNNSIVTECRKKKVSLKKVTFKKVTFLKVPRRTVGRPHSLKV